MENKPVPPVIPEQAKEKTESKPHPKIPQPEKKVPVQKEPTLKKQEIFELKTILALVFGIGALVFTMLSAFTGVFYFLAVAAGVAGVVLSLLSLEITKPKILALVVSIVGLGIAVTIAGTSLFTSIRLSWTFNQAFHNNYDYNYGDSFWDDGDDFWD